MSDTIKLGNLEISSFKVGSSNVDKIYLGSTLLYPSTPHDYSQDYFTIESLDDNNTIYFKADSKTYTKTISVSTDGGTTWTNYTSSTGGSGVTLATLSIGKKILIKGSNLAYAGSSWSNNFKSSGNIKISGNIMSLRYGDEFLGKTNFGTGAGSNYIFKELFSNSTKLTSAKNLVLPATTLSSYCYYGMFRNCTSLTTAPELPATTLASYCYYGMFFQTKITTAPVLPATTLSSYCYFQMFGYCSSLTTAPSLPATTLANNCYQEMFESCTSLTSAPELPATTLADYCYRQMFQGCTSLNNITCLATDISATNCTYNWVQRVSSTGTFTKAASMTDWPSGISGIPANWTVKNYS